MKIRHLILMLIACIAMIASCVKVDYTLDNRIPTNPKGEYAILFSHPAPITKAQTTSISGTGYDSFSLFSWNAINDTIMNPYTVMAKAEQSYQYEDVTGQEIKYFKRVADWYDFIGVIPTTHTMKLKDGAVKVEGVTSFVVDDKRSEKAVNLTDTLYWSAGLAVESPEEFLTAYKRVAKADYGNVVELPFVHQNALIFLGFSSDKTDTKIIDYAPGTPDIPAVPAVYDTTYRVKFSSNIWNRSGGNITGIDDTKLEFINSLYTLTSLDGTTTYPVNDWPTSGGPFILKVNYDLIPAAYRKNWTIGNYTNCIFFDYVPYFSDNNITVPDANFNAYDILIHIKKNTNGTYTGVKFSAGAISGSTNSLPVITEITPAQPAQPGRPALEGVRVFSADSTGVNNVPTDTLYCVHIPHTVTADATIDANGCVLSNRVTTDDVIQFSLPATTTLSETPVWSPTTFYALPGDTNFNFIVVKLSYIYNGITTYDVRVPIHLPDGGLQPGKYYKYELYITSTSNGTNDPNEASDEKDEIIIEDNPVIQVRLVESGYTQGDERRFTI